MVAVNITNGKLIWATPFIAEHTVLKKVRVPDTHDWDTSWGSSVTNVRFDNGTEEKVVVGHDKMGNIIAMDAYTGNEIWWKTMGNHIMQIQSPCQMEAVLYGLMESTPIMQWIIIQYMLQQMLEDWIFLQIKPVAISCLLLTQ